MEKEKGNFKITNFYNAVVGDVDGADVERRHIEIDSHLIKQILD